jgi:hypothetical protein
MDCLNTQHFENGFKMAETYFYGCFGNRIFSDKSAYTYGCTPPFPPLRGPENSSKVKHTPNHCGRMGSGGSEPIIYIIRPAKRLNALGVIILDGALPDW